MADTINAEEKEGRNTIATILRVNAYVICIGGFFAGIELANVEIPYTYFSGSYTEFSIKMAIYYWAIFFVSGTIFFGFAEIITLLQKLVDKDCAVRDITASEKIDKTDKLFTDLPEL